MFLKTLGIAFIIGGFGGWGLLKANRLSRRVEQLRQIKMALGFLDKEICYMHTPLSRALLRTAHFIKPPAAKLFAAAADKLQDKQGITASEAWNYGLQQLQQEADLNREDLELLQTAALQIGMSDASEQKKFFAMLQEELKLQETKAWQEVESGGKLWQYGGFILGAVVVLLLI